VQDLNIFAEDESQLRCSADYKAVGISVTRTRGERFRISPSSRSQDLGKVISPSASVVHSLSGERKGLTSRLSRRHFPIWQAIGNLMRPVTFISNKIYLKRQLLGVFRSSLWLHKMPRSRFPEDPSFPCFRLSPVNQSAHRHLFSTSRFTFHGNENVRELFHLE
jgi:hypothetical protein